MYEYMNAMYEYMQYRVLGRLILAQVTKPKIKMIRSVMNERFNNISSYVNIATYLQLRQGLQTVVSVVGAVEAIRNDQQTLQTLSVSDRSRMRAIAKAALKRKRERGQMMDVDEEETDSCSIAVSPDGRHLAARPKAASVWDIATGTVVLPLESFVPFVKCLSWSPCCGMLAGSSNFGTTLTVWNTATGACLHNLQGHTNEVTCVSWSPRGGMWSIML
jgi:WD40 repeat protein